MLTFLSDTNILEYHLDLPEEEHEKVIQGNCSYYSFTCCSSIGNGFGYGSNLQTKGFSSGFSSQIR